MSRLQVGGLALIVGHTRCDRNLGKTVKLDAYKGTCSFDDGSAIGDLWQVSGDDLIWADGRPQDYCFAQSKHLMPLGDKQTQDELAKELANDPLLATHYRPQTGQYLKLENGQWFIEVNGYWQYIRNPFGYKMVAL